ncbi:MAG: 23S rRNA (pseudouridine(1915)-N(3))-methyltransferase RlmH [Bdellovibrio sp. CG22_combo_CG10-13_8_21_14_all_39_27]|nr:MAG: 23S rRNA (pseudouridine(1915)-N(3))-methyltransferase RlmH [Bdellovibrio sp. CG22_combo_CG10-13_8_21_14_all_39_27]
MRIVHILTTGKLRESGLRDFEAEYLKRLQLFQIQIHECKAYAEDLDLEARDIILKVKDIQKNSAALKIIGMMEKGRERDSVQLAQWLDQHFKAGSDLILIIGGASGHGSEVQALFHEKMSLSLLTYPHQLARVVLVEQLYRAQTILQGHPYHK